jgi:hypothetical protein
LVAQGEDERLASSLLGPARRQTNGCRDAFREVRVVQDLDGQLAQGGADGIGMGTDYDSAGRGLGLAGALSS